MTFSNPANCMHGLLLSSVFDKETVAPNNAKTLPNVKWLAFCRDMISIRSTRPNQRNDGHHDDGRNKWSRSFSANLMGRAKYSPPFPKSATQRPRSGTWSYSHVRRSLRSQIPYAILYRYLVWWWHCVHCAVQYGWFLSSFSVMTIKCKINQNNVTITIIIATSNNERPSAASPVAAGRKIV